jgi:hypothetical protein
MDRVALIQVVLVHSVVYLQGVAYIIHSPRNGSVKRVKPTELLIECFRNSGMSSKASLNHGLHMGLPLVQFLVNHLRQPSHPPSDS